MNTVWVMLNIVMRNVFVLNKVMLNI